MVIGLVYYLFAILQPHQCHQYPVILFGACCGFVGSLIDSLLGATCQATYYSPEKKAIVRDPRDVAGRVDHISGLDLLSNEAVNFVSIAATMVTMAALFPWIYW